METNRHFALTNAKIHDTVKEMICMKMHKNGGRYEEENGTHYFTFPLGQRVVYAIRKTQNETLGFNGHKHGFV